MDKKWALEIKNAGGPTHTINLLNIKDRVRITLSNVDESFQLLCTTIENDEGLNTLAAFLIRILNESEAGKVYSALDIYTELMKEPVESMGQFPESGFYWIRFCSNSRWRIYEYDQVTDTFYVGGAPFKVEDVYKIYPQRLILPNEILAKPRAECDEEHF